MLNKFSFSLITTLLFAQPALAQEGATAVKNCEKNNVEACALAGSHYQWGTGGLKQDSALSMKHYQKACDGKIGSGCFGVALLYDNPTYPKNDSAKAQEFYKKACDLRHEYGCQAVEASKKRK